jgi:hypothetical protein
MERNILLEGSSWAGLGGIFLGVAAALNGNLVEGIGAIVSGVLAIWKR